MSACPMGLAKHPSEYRNHIPFEFTKPSLKHRTSRRHICYVLLRKTILNACALTTCVFSLALQHIPNTDSHVRVYLIWHAFSSQLVCANKLCPRTRLVGHASCAPTAATYNIICAFSLDLRSLQILAAIIGFGPQLSDRAHGLEARSVHSAQRAEDHLRRNALRRARCVRLMSA